MSTDTSPTNALSDTLLERYVEQFFGFGRWGAKIWFVGIEEAGGWEFTDAKRRLTEWEKRRERPLEDAPVFYPACGNKRWHGTGATVQKTWRQLIRMLLLARGKPDTEDAILDYQRTRLGAAEDETCLAELLPLPSPNIGAWKYNQWSSLPWLQSRDLYLSKNLQRRAKSLRQQIADHKPKVVVFYGTTLPGRTSLLPYWSQIADGRFEQAIKTGKILLRRKTNEIVFFVTRHPTSETDDYFKKIGRFFRDEHRDLF